MMKFCYLNITNNDNFAKCSFVLICNVCFSIFVISSLKNIISFIICNVLFAKFIKTPNFCTLVGVCAILFRQLQFLHTSLTVCNFVFAHI